MRKILVAEDNPASRELIREILEIEGYRVVEACDGLEALQKVDEETPDLLLLDIQMPVKDGYALLRQLRQGARFSALRVVALTASAMRGDREKALGAGFDAYIAKPIDAAALRTQIEHLFS